MFKVILISFQLQSSFEDIDMKFMIFSSFNVFILLYDVMIKLPNAVINIYVRK